MKKIQLIGPDGEKTTIDLLDDFVINEENIRDTIHSFIEHLDEQELDLLLVDSVGASKQIYVPNFERFVEMLELKAFSGMLMDEGTFEFILEVAEKPVLN